MSAREIIAEQCDGAYSEKRADRILASLATHGFRILAPGSLDRETIERCIEVIQEGEEVPDPRDDGRSTIMESWRDEDKLIAAIRALGAEK